MIILSRQEASSFLNNISPDVFVARLHRQLRLVEASYSAPIVSGVQIALSKLFAHLSFRNAPICLNITGWGIATEHLDLFDGYRRSLGETRSLIDAPFHCFELTEEEAFVSFLCMVFFFSWDASIFDLEGRLLLQTSHDGWLEVRTNEDDLIREVAAELKSYGIPFLSRA
jgi:hypothetical protein